MRSKKVIQIVHLYFMYENYQDSVTNNKTEYILHKLLLYNTFNIKTVRQARLMLDKFGDIAETVIVLCCVLYMNTNTDVSYSSQADYKIDLRKVA